MHDWMKSCSWRKIFCLALVLASMLAVNIPCTVHAEEDECWGAALLSIKTKTKEPSAEFFLKIHQDEEKAYERKKIGIGETFTLSLSGKMVEGGNSANAKEVKWFLISGKEYLESWPDKTTNRATMELTAKQRFLKKDLDQSGRKKNGKVVIQVELEDKRSEKLELEVSFPSSIEGKHYQGGTPSAIFPNFFVGTSVILELRVHPMDVCFKDLPVIERDLGSVPEGKSLDPSHTPTQGCDQKLNLDGGNRVADRTRCAVSGFDLISQNGQPPVHQLPQEWDWVCQWRVHYGVGGLNGKDMDGPVIDTVNQHFSFKQSASPQGDVYFEATLQKFGCTATRNTLDGKNYFGPPEKLR